MALKESTMRGTVVKLLSSMHAVSIENGVGVGTPDVEYVDGWLELKSVDLPKNPDTPVRVPHFTPQQKVFLRKRTACGGIALLFLKAGPWWLLFDGVTAAEIVGKVSLGALVDRCIVGWQTTPPKQELVSCLKRICRAVKSCTWSDGDESKPSDMPPLNTEFLRSYTGAGKKTWGQRSASRTSK